MASDHSHTTPGTDFSADSGAPAWSPLQAPGATAVPRSRPLDLVPRVLLEGKVLRLVREFLAREGYVEVSVPMLTPATGSCEVVDSMFTVDYFGSLAFPRQTGQLYLEELVVRGLPAVYCEGQSLRKEWKVDDRHLTEFKLIEIERRDMGLEALCDLEERLVKFVAERLSAEDVGGANATRLDRMLRSEHPRLTYREAIAALRRRGFALEFGDDLGREAEAALVHYVGHLPVHVTHFPESLKFFNMKVDRNDPLVVECVDYILPYSGETFGGSVREPDTEILRRRLYNGTMYHHLMNRAREFAQDQWHTRESVRSLGTLEDLETRFQESIQASFERYVSLFEGNPIERAGFGLGVARLLQYLMGLDSIKDAVAFPMDRTSFGTLDSRP
jgi:asparaginyl-tRNA synthetase